MIPAVRNLKNANSAILPEKPGNLGEKKLQPTNRPFLEFTKKISPRHKTDSWEGINK